MSPASTAGKPGKLGDKEFEEAFKPGTKGVPADKVGKAKKKSPLVMVVIIVLIILVLIAGGVAGLYLTGNLNPLLQAVGLGSLVDTSQGDRAAALDAREAALNAREQALNDLQKQLDDQAAQSSTAPSTSPSGTDGQTTTTTSTQTLEELLTGLSTEKLTELQQVGAIYSKMDAVSAGAIMTKVYDAQQIAVIVYYMQPAAAALLLSKLDPQLAADVTKILAS
ncbi:hypothetical protein IZU99_08700 [Oscillospiraceae bacterium CM]|nr:hypothetical protein IZU99_08700 [Oscillospiraceae bacterium CM]